VQPSLSYVLVVFSVVASGVAHAQIQFGGFRVGGSKPAAQQQKPAAQQQKEAAQETEQPNNRAATDAWRVVQREQGDRLVRLYEYATQKTPGPTGNDQYARRALDDLKELAKLDDVKKGCAEGRFKGEDAGVTRDGACLTAAIMCPLVAKAEEHTKKGLREWANAYAESRLSSGKETLATIEKEKRIFLTDAIEGIDSAGRRKYVTSFVKDYYDALGEPVPETILVKVDALVAETKKAIEAAAAVGKMEKPASKDAGAERAIKEAYASRKDIQIKRVWLVDASWKIKKNDIGLITNRYKDGSVLVKVKGANACIIVPAAVGQSYAGGGRYAAGYSVDEYTSGTAVSCK